MSDDIALRQEIRQSFDDIRRRIRSYTGLYSTEDLIRDVTHACDEMTMAIAHSHRLEEARSAVEDRCRRLAQVTDRFTTRDPVVIAASRAQAIAAVDALQDAIFQARKASVPVPRLGPLLRRRSL
jgi:hypothetical protein